MGIQSMTGFGRGLADGSGLSIGVEIKSVNHRFMDTRFRIPSEFLDIELKLKKILTKNFKRGSFDIFITCNASDENIINKLDKEKIKKYVEEMSSLIGVAPQFSSTEFLRPEFYIDGDDSGKEELHSLANISFKEAVENLLQTRTDEGQRLVEVVKEHIGSFKDEYLKIEKLAGSYQKLVESKLKKRLIDLKDELSLDENRFYQEVVYYMEKLDIHEEINRINSHLQELSSIIEKKGEVGRKIEFLLQELNRETNTIGSKANLTEISESVVQMKVHLEKIREQALNLE